ncbi:DUF4397 domain-containing protein [Haloferax prahovense]|uniref:DUF4397 domain-containing protein n=1 Tax=Haloferax prahovense TaxID=381852 RepID=UPI003C73B51A
MLKSLGATGLLLAGGATTAAARPGGVAAGDARFRVGHFSPDAPEVDIVVKDGPALFSGLAFGDVSHYETVPAGTYDLQVALSSDGTVVLDLPGTTLAGGRIYTVFAIGFATGGSPGFSVLPVVDAVSPARAPPSNGNVCRVR